MVRFKCLDSFKSLMAANINTHNTVHHTQIIWHYTCIFIILLTTQPGALNTLVPLKMLFMHKKLWKTLYLPVFLELALETAWTDQSFLDSVVCQYCWLLFLRNWRKTEKKKKFPHPTITIISHLKLSFLDWQDASRYVVQFVWFLGRCCEFSLLHCDGRIVCASCLSSHLVGDDVSWICSMHICLFVVVCWCLSGVACL